MMRTRSFAGIPPAPRPTAKHKKRSSRSGPVVPNRPVPEPTHAGLAIFRYKTRCGTVYGHTGNTPGYTQFISATRSGSRSATVAVNAQITPGSDAKTFAKLRNIFELAVCAALANE